MLHFSCERVSKKTVDCPNKFFLFNFLLYAVSTRYTFTQFVKDKFDFSTTTLIGVSVSKSIKGQISCYLPK